MGDVTNLRLAVLDAAPLICEEGARLREADLAASAPIDTGALSQSGQVTVEATGDGAVAVLRFTEEYASYLDTGTGPHRIEGNPLLAFEWGGTTVIVRSVNHPGSTKWKGWFTDRAGDEQLWSLAVQSALDGALIQ